MSTSNPPLSKLESIPTGLLMRSTIDEDLFKWIASHEPSRRDIYIEFRIIIITFVSDPHVVQYKHGMMDTKLDL
jgi:hypothetical protein